MNILEFLNNIGTYSRPSNFEANQYLQNIKEIFDGPEYALDSNFLPFTTDK